MKLPQFDEMHIVSDLHMGGVAGFQILRETKRLAAFVKWVAARRPEGRVALVLNGDIIDTLAEAINGYIAASFQIGSIEYAGETGEVEFFDA